MDTKEADDAEFQGLVEHHKAEIEASNMTREELVYLLARNLATYNLLCSSYEESSRQFKESIKIQAQVIELLEKQNTETERKFIAAVNAIPKAVNEGLNAGVDLGKKRQASKAGKQGGINKNALSNELKAWALQQAATMRGADRDIARELVNRIPGYLAKASTDPERLIYDALREKSKQGKPKPVRGFLPDSRLAASRNR